MNPVQIVSWVLLILGVACVAIWYAIDSNAQRLEDLFTSEPTPLNEAKPTDTSVRGVTVQSIEDVQKLAELSINDVISTSSLPASFNFPDSQLVPAENQGTCGSCWAYTVAKVIASRVKIHSQGKFGQRLSPQQLIDCSGAMQDCNVGGSFTQALNYMVNNGLVSEGAYPNTSNNWNGTGTGINECNSKPEETYRVFVDPTSIKKVSDPVDIKKTVFYFGPVIIRFYVDQTLYDYSWPNVWSYDPGKTPLNHITEVIGWDDSKVAWICRNTWGRGWGNQGRFYLAYDQIQGAAVNANPTVVLADSATLLDNLPAFLSRYAAADQNKSQEWLGWTGLGLVTAAIGMYLAEELFTNRVIKNTPVGKIYS